MKRQIKKNKNQKSQSSIIAIILIILLCLIAIIILWRVVIPMSQNTKQLTEIRRELSKTRIGIKDVTINGDIIEITLLRGSGEINILNRTTKNYTVTKTETTTSIVTILNNLSIVSVIDVSGSMGDKDILNYYIGECKANKTSNCCTTNDCTTSLGCSTCNGTLLNNECYLYSLNTCCKDKDCFKQGNCTSCGGTWNPQPNKDPCSIKSCYDSIDYCKNNCKGVWRNKLNITQEANIKFIDNIFSKNPNNKMGIVAFSDGVNKPHDYLTLTNNLTDLKNKVNSLYPEGETNIYEGIKQAQDMLIPSTNKQKVIVLMSDGVATRPLGSPTLSAINQAILANKSNITIYTIGFGYDADTDTLKKIANSTTNGSYTYADISQLSYVYNSVVQTIPTTLTQVISENKTITEIVYEDVQIFQKLKIVIYNDTNSYVYDNITDKNILSSLESKTYSIPTGGITNINNIEIYLVVRLESGEEISQLVATWTPNSENPQYMPAVKSLK